MKYKKLAAFKKFPREKLEGISEIEHTKLIEKFSRDYEQTSIGFAPDYNLLENVKFDTRQGPFDIYNYCYFRSSIIVSNRLLIILRDLYLAEHKVFPGIRYTFKGEERDDMNLLIFYKDYTQFIDYSKSIYQIVKSDHTFHKDEEGNLKQEAIIKDNIKFKSKEEFHFNRRKRDPLSNDPKTVFKYLHCTECIKLDIFYFNAEEKGLYLSPHLVKRLADEKIKGVDFWGNFTFEFNG